MYDQSMTSSMEIDPHGARITSLMLKDIPVLFFGKRGDGKDGVTHPCTPNFGRDPSPRNLPQHGPMRNAECIVEKQTPDHVILSYTITHENYPRDVKVIQDFMVRDNVFTLTTSHHNAGTVEAPVNFGEHFYWNAPNGWEGVKINGQNVTELVKINDSVNLRPSNTIEIPGQPRIVLEQEGFSQSVLWAYNHPETGIFDASYVCIEPIERRVELFNQKESMLPPGKTRTTMLQISLS